MNYRIFFNYQTAKFEVQILAYIFFWRTAKGMTYETLGEAQSKINQIGLDKLYVNKSADTYRHALLHAA